MMQQVLQITTTPIEYKLEMESSRLEYNQADNARVDVTQRPARLNMESQNIQVRIDTMDMRRSLGFETNTDRARNGAQRGRENLGRFMSEQTQTGNSLARIEDGVKIADVVRQKMEQQPEYYTAFLPSEGPKISWVPAQLKKDYQAGDINFDWQTMRNVLEYVPGRFQMNITQYPKVEIMYTGRPMYIPPSSDPEYVEPED